MSRWRGAIPNLDNVELREAPAGWRFGRHTLRTLRGWRNTSDIMHIHGIWRSLAGFALYSRRGSNAATVLAPHGMLSPWALNNNAIRKKFARRAGWNRLISSTDLFHAVSVGEEHEIRALNFGVRVTVIPNGVSVSEIANETMEFHREADSSLPYILYLARLHRMKGPDLLLNAFADVARSAGPTFGYRLIMAGPDFGEKTALESQARKLGIADRVQFPGPVFGEAKRELYRGATIVCQPSRYEAFSLSLLEALASGVPVLTTPQANFPEIQSHQAGIVCSAEIGELAHNMRLLLSRPELRLQLGKSGSALVLSKYTWDRIAVSSLAAYESALQPAL
jgi:glycosyltransferase involved in cell wall biosynthesis